MRIQSFQEESKPETDTAIICWKAQKRRSDDLLDWKLSSTGTRCDTNPTSDYPPITSREVFSTLHVHIRAKVREKITYSIHRAWSLAMRRRNSFESFTREATWPLQNQPQLPRDISSHSYLLTPRTEIATHQLFQEEPLNTNSISKPFSQKNDLSKISIG